MANEASPKYDAFISYSHAMDSRLAPRLQDALHAFAKKWYARRALHTFRDRTGLSVTPELWPDIERALAASRYLLLLASPEGAASRWIQREVSWWLEHRSAQTILIVLTGGDLKWDGASGDFDWSRSSAVPAMLRRRFSEEPLYVDLRWAHDVEQLSLRHPQFREVVIDIAARLHGKARDELDGEDLRQHRRFKTLAWTAVIALSVLTVVSGMAAYQAIRSALLAEARRVEAERQRDLALARQLSVQSTRLVDEPSAEFDRAALLAAASLGRAHIFENDLAARDRLELLPVGADVLPHGSPVRALVFSGDGRYLLTGTADGAARLWRRDSASVLRRFEHGAPVQAVALTADGRRVITGASDGTVREWNVDTGHSSLAVAVDVHGSDRYLVAFSEDGARAVTATVAEDVGADIRVWDLRRKTLVGRIALNRLAASFALNHDGTRVVTGTWTGAVHVRTVGQNDEMVRQFEGRIAGVAFGARAHEVVVASDRTVWVFDASRPDSIATDLRYAAGASSVVLRADRVLTGGRGPATFWDARTRTPLARLSHAGPVGAVAISPDGGFVATGGRRRNRSRLARRIGQVLRAPRVRESPPVGPSRDGRTARGDVVRAGRCVRRRRSAWRTGIGHPPERSRRRPQLRRPPFRQGPAIGGRARVDTEQRTRRRRRSRNGADSRSSGYGFARVRARDQSRRPPSRRRGSGRDAHRSADRRLHGPARRRCARGAAVDCLQFGRAPHGRRHGR